MVERSTSEAISRAQRIMEDLPVRLPAIGDAFVRDSVTATRRKLGSLLLPMLSISIWRTVSVTMQRPSTISSRSLWPTF